MLIADATEADLSGILAIYNEVIARTTAVYSNEPVTLENRFEWWSGRVVHGYPVLVCARCHRRHGVCHLWRFSSLARVPIHGRAYRARARRLSWAGDRERAVQALFPRATALGKHVMIAGVDAANIASIRFHEALGFEQVALLREVGRKFNRWPRPGIAAALADAAGAPR